MSTPFVYEFLYRGHPAESDTPPAYHVILGRLDDPLPGQTRPEIKLSAALTPAQADAAGFSLSTIIDGLNGGALAQIEAANADRDAAAKEADALRGDLGAASEAAASAQTVVATLREQVEALTIERDTERAEASGARAEASTVREERDALRAQLDALTAPPPALVVSDRQFFQALAIGGDITEDEALAAVMTGTMPERIAAAVASLPEDQRFAAKMLLSGATTFDRHHPMVALLGQILGKGKDEATLDALWKRAADL